VTGNIGSSQCVSFQRPTAIHSQDEILSIETAEGWSHSSSAQFLVEEKAKQCQHHRNEIHLEPNPAGTRALRIREEGMSRASQRDQSASAKNIMLDLPHARRYDVTPTKIHNVLGTTVETQPSKRMDTSKDQVALNRGLSFVSSYSIENSGNSICQTGSK
jgi:hypothetical protein